MLALLLEPLRGLIEYTESSHSRLADVFPALLFVFNYYRIIMISPNEKIP